MGADGFAVKTLWQIFVLIKLIYWTSESLNMDWKNVHRPWETNAVPYTNENLQGNSCLQCGEETESG